MKRRSRRPSSGETSGGRLDETRTWILKEGLPGLRKRERSDRRKGSSKG